MKLICYFIFKKLNNELKKNSFYNDSNLNILNKKLKFITER